MTASGEVEEAEGAEVLAAAARLIDAFGAHDLARYFAGFGAEATFLFHTEPALIASKQEYEIRWREWEGEGFRVLGCRSLEPAVQRVGADVAIFTHRVRTRVEGVEHELRERESIVFHRIAPGEWLAVHEHLSPEP